MKTPRRYGRAMHRARKKHRAQVRRDVLAFWFLHVVNQNLKRIADHMDRVFLYGASAIPLTPSLEELR